MALIVSVLSVIMLMTLLPTAAFAAENPSENVLNGDAWRYDGSNYYPISESDFGTPLGTNHVRLSQQVIADNDDGTFDVEVKVEGGSAVNFNPEEALVFVLDSSASISPSQWYEMKAACIKMVNSYPEETNIFFGIVRFSDYAGIFMPLSNDRRTVISSLGQLTQAGLYTNIGEGLMRAKQVLDAYTGSGPKTAVVVTDGAVNQPTPNPRQYMADRANELKGSGADVYAIGVGPAPLQLELEIIASYIPNVQTIYSLADFSDLAEALSSIASGTATIGMDSNVDFVSFISISNGGENASVSGGTLIWNLENNAVNTLVYRIRAKDRMLGRGFQQISNIAYIRYGVANNRFMAFFDIPSVQMDSCTLYGHDWGDWEINVHATCEADGVEIRECNNAGAYGDIHTEYRVIPALGHAWGEWEVTTAATCTAVGEETRVCANDPAHFETREIPALGHDGYAGETYEAVITAATCETPGEMGIYCSDCGELLYAVEIPALGHEWVLTDHKDATATEDGYDYYECSRCDESYSVVIPATGETEPIIVGVSNAKFISIVETSKNSRVWVLTFEVTVTYSNGETEIRQFSINLNGNNANLDGEFVFGDDHDLAGYTLTYDIKGNGKNIKAFSI